ncbi:PREDICTED: vomeronasal type-1 receptor 92-like [Crocodylus porosus]|uniref:vomeronasal type-1 receptor 92-like n=1 Tax=Crocodylus porosus TaxID=8502 RepID=UPI00093B4D68|nr:PREDICTED: vomeronasal type-1 receptor 92-like [Crocodylus porosus]
MVFDPAYIAAIIIYLSALLGTVGNLVILFAFISNAIRHKVLQPLDKIIINMALVNLLLCCYKEIPGLLFFTNTKIFGEQECRILLYTYHMLRLISIWSVENLSFLHLIKIQRPNHRWSKFIYRHQGQYVNSILAGCWIFSILFHIPYLQNDKEIEKNTNRTIIYLGATSCIRSTGNFLTKFTTYSSVSLDLIVIILVIILNGFIINLLCKHRRKVRAVSTMDTSWNKHTAQATKILLSLLSIYVVCWISSDMVWIAIVSGLIESNFEHSILNSYYGLLSSVYYSASSYVVVFGYRKVREYLNEACWCLKCKKSTVVQSVE